MGKKPTFINIGPGRAGTSWLYQILKEHPEVCMGVIKETEFFNTHYEKGFPWYERHFSHCHGKKAVGEISNNYYLDKNIAHRICNYNSDTKIIINIRYPPTLLLSFYQFSIRRGLELGPIENALLTPIGKIMGSGFDYRMKKGRLTIGDTMTLLESVLLFDRISAYIETFGSDNIYFMIYERIKREPEVLIKEIYNFIGVNYKYQPSNIKTVVNASIEPKLRIIAVLASKTAFILRKSGCYRLLTKAHSSGFIKRMLYRERKQVGEDIFKDINPYAKEKIKNNIKKLIQCIPSLGLYWEKNDNFF